MKPRTTIRSPYMEFAKLRSAAKYNLATSGVMNYSLAELPVGLEQLEINGPTAYGYEPLIRRLAAKNGAPADCVVYVNGGTSLANHLAIAATTEPGDEVLIETPGYELIDNTAEFLGLKVQHFERRFEEQFRVNVEEIERCLTPRTRLIVITNLHNPSGVMTDNDTLRRTGELARKAGARVLVDEVYLDMAFAQTPPSSFHLDPDIFVVTNSLTKTYGLSGIRCGWILAEPGLAHRIWRIHDVYGATPTHIAELLAIACLDNLSTIGARAQRILETNRAELMRFLELRPEAVAVRTEFGSVSFPRLLRGSAGELISILREKYETSVVPGSFFGMPQHFRVGLGGDPEMTREGMARLARAVEELAG